VQQPPCNAAAALPLLVFVQSSSERTLNQARRDNSFPEKQDSHLARLLVVVHGGRLVAVSEMPA
jgi:hypothetical protein